MSVHFVSLKGDRHSNEDKHNIILNMNGDNKTADVNFYGVYDGHGGKFISNFLSNNISQYFTGPNVKYPLDKNYVNKVYDILDAILKEKYSKQATECGSTCLVVCNYKRSDKQYLNIMNTGDSRCVLCRNNIGIALTKDHKPDWYDEKVRISKLGGNIRKDGPVYRIYDLSVSRAFGDFSAKKCVTHRPDIYKYTIKPSRDRFMIIACDGLWDVVSSQEAVNFVLDNCYDISLNRINHKMNISRKLAEHAISLDSGDNVTCIVVFFD
jgi:serine/threonine protein phosphatase PrpC